MQSHRASFEVECELAMGWPNVVMKHRSAFMVNCQRLGREQFVDRSGQFRERFDFRSHGDSRIRFGPVEGFQPNRVREG
jgi:hypothetical protein